MATRADLLAQAAREAQWSMLCARYGLDPTMDRLEAEALAIGMDAHSAILQERGVVKYNEGDRRWRADD